LRNRFRFTRHEIVFDDLSARDFNDFDLIVPLTINDVRYLSTMRDQLKWNPIPIPSLECIELCDDKYRFNQALIQSELKDLVPQMGGNLNYPYILKKKTDEWGANCHIIESEETVKALSDKLTDSAYFTQELVLGREQYSAHILFKNNQVVFSVDIKHVFNTKHPIQGRDASSYTRVRDCPYLDQFVAVLTHIGFEGLCCIDYKVRDNAPLILEINPRFGGSLCRYFIYFIQVLNRPDRRLSQPHD
jgi:carbamoylphosphate synthase large subunit